MSNKIVKFIRYLLGYVEVELSIDLVVSPQDRTLLDTLLIKLVVKKHDTNPVVVGDILLVEGYTTSTLVVSILDTQRVLDVSTMSILQIQTVATIVGGELSDRR